MRDHVFESILKNRTILNVKVVRDEKYVAIILALDSCILTIEADGFKMKTEPYLKPHGREKLKIPGTLAELQAWKAKKEGSLH